MLWPRDDVQIMDSPDIVSNYYILLLVGIAAIGFHAYGLFSQRVVDSNHGALHADLNLLPVISIAGKKDFSKGYLLYLLTFEAVYIVLASSTTLLSFVLNLANREDTVGALSSQIAPNAAIPVLASTALILLSQIKPFARFENYIRDISHGVSGVPTNARDVKDRIASTLAGKIKDLDEGVSQPLIEGKYSLLAACRKKSRSLYKRLIEDGVDETKASTFFISYCNVLYLHEVTLGYTGISEWNREETNTVIELFRSIDYELDAMEALIRDYTALSTPDDMLDGTDAEADESLSAGEPGRTGKRWKSVTEQCITLEQRLLLLLALLFINRPDAELSANSLLKDVMHQSVTTREQRMGNVVLSSVIVGLAVSLLVLPTYKMAVDESKAWLRESPYENKLPLLGKGNRNGANSALPLSEVLFNGMNKDELESASSMWAGAANKIGSRIRFWAYEIIKPALIFLVSAGVTLAYRNRAMAERRWKSGLLPGHDNVPLLRYLSAGLYAYLATLGAVFFYHFIVLALIPAIQSQNDFMTYEGMEVLSAAIPEIMYFSLTAFLISYFVSDYCDFARWRDSANSASASIPWMRVLVFATACGTLNWIVKTSLGKVNTGWDVLNFFAVPFLGFSVFLSAFGFFLWLYENEKTPRRHGSTIGQAMVNLATSMPFRRFRKSTKHSREARDEDAKPA